jgi:hypothetical protein
MACVLVRVCTTAVSLCRFVQDLSSDWHAVTYMYTLNQLCGMYGRRKHLANRVRSDGEFPARPTGFSERALTS